MNRTGFALLLLIVILTRLPFVFAGYGTDPDAWRVAASATKLWQTGTYEVSRYPGYPLHELVSAPLVGLGGAALSNAVTLLCSLILLLVWHRMTLRESRNPALLVIILAFTPLFWKNSATTMDYVWSLLFILLAFDKALGRKALMAGILVGIAAGFRPANAIAALPVLVPLLYADRPVRAVVQFAGAAIAVAFCIFAPMVSGIGMHTWVSASAAQIAGVRAQQSPGFLTAAYRAVYAFGPPALAFLLLVIASRWKIIRTVRVTSDPVMTGAIVAITVFGTLFLWLPLEREYLLPLVPFVLLLLDRWCTRWQLVVTGVLLFSFAIINPDIVSHDGPVGRVQPGLRPGMIMEEWNKHGVREETRAMILSVHQPRKTLVMTAFPDPYWLGDTHVEPTPAPFHERLYRNRPDSLVFHTFCLSAPELAVARAQGYALYILPEAVRFVERSGGFSVEQENVTIIPSSP